MDATFISIHDLTPEARLLYSSDSVIDILGYTPDEIVNRSCWDFFPQQELPYAKHYHQQGVTMDKAAVLVYCKVKSKSGEWIGCECCFTIVYDVMIVCTSRYSQDEGSQERALAAPVVRRLFTSSPKDPRYHMLSHLSAKFTQSAKPSEHEPRAALFLNRFTRTLTIMYATSGIQDILGIPAEVMRGKSFYYCVAENCLQDTIKCLENAKANHSIAYLRFWFRDPRTGEPSPEHTNDDSDEEMTEYSEEGGVHLRSDMSDNLDNGPHSSRASSGDSGNQADSHEAIFGQALHAQSSASSLDPSPTRERSTQRDRAIELEAVVSCASDGLVVCLRRARPMIPHPTHRPGKAVYANGLFAAPWAAKPMLPPLEVRSGTGFASSFAPSLGPMGARHESVTPTRGGPASNDFMAAIRDQAIFAWALTGINGALAFHGHGTPSQGCLPEDGLPIWASDNQAYSTDDRQGAMQWTISAQNGHSPDTTRPPTAFFGDPGLARTTNFSPQQEIHADRRW